MKQLGRINNPLTNSLYESKISKKGNEERKETSQEDEKVINNLSRYIFMDAVKYKITNKQTGEVIEVIAHGSGQDNGVLYTEFAPAAEAGTEAWEKSPILYRFVNNEGVLTSDQYDIVKDEPVVEA